MKKTEQFQGSIEQFQEPAAQCQEPSKQCHNPAAQCQEPSAQCQEPASQAIQTSLTSAPNMTITERFQATVPYFLDWFDGHARELPWRKPDTKTGRPDPYRVWISEIMLQQTRVETVKDYYRRFLTALPTVSALAEVPEDDLLKLWQGLGYYNRARNLKKAALMIQEDYRGDFPSCYEELRKLPGIGEYTAGAIASIAFGEPVPAIDGNLYRIVTRLFEYENEITKAATKKELRQVLQSAINAENASIFNQALMDLGATVCLPNGQPHCKDCPIRTFCLAGEHQSWAAYPVKPPKKNRRLVERTVFLLEYQGTYYLQKRPEQGLLAGLWEFPATERFLALDLLPDYLSHRSITDYELTLLGKAKHIFSHVEWHMIGYKLHLKQKPPIASDQPFIWADPETIRQRYSIPSALQYYAQNI